MQVYLIRLNSLNESGTPSETIGVMTLAKAELAIERSMNRLVAVDIDTGQVLAASHEKDLYRGV